MNSPLVLIDHRGSSSWLTLNNPERRNAIGPVMVSDLLYALDELEARQETRSVVFTGAGDKAFCAGGDFSQMAGGPSEQSRPMKGDYSDLLIRLRHYPKPLIARVNGHAMGGGLGIVAASHFAVGLAPAKLGTPEVDVGLFPMMIMRVLAPLMPRRALVRMMLLGERYEAPRAAELGLLGRVVGDIDGLDAAVHELVTSIEAKSPITLRLGLEAMAQQEELSFREALPYLQRQLGAVLATDDAAEGLQAFLQKRPPVWQGK